MSMTREEQIEEFIKFHAHKFSVRNGYETIEELMREMAQWCDNNPKSPWISVKEQLPPDPKYWTIKGIVGAKIDSGFSYFELFGYVYPKGWVNKELLPFEECNITHWMPIPQLPEK